MGRLWRFEPVQDRLPVLAISGNTTAANAGPWILGKKIRRVCRVACPPEGGIEKGFNHVLRDVRVKFGLWFHLLPECFCYRRPGIGQLTRFERGEFRQLNQALQCCQHVRCSGNQSGISLSDNAAVYRVVVAAVHHG